MGGSYQNLAALTSGTQGFSMLGASGLENGGPLAFPGDTQTREPRTSFEAGDLRSKKRFILVSNHLPIKASRTANDDGWDFEWDQDALIAEAHAGLSVEFDVLHVGTLTVDVDDMEEEAVSQELAMFNCCPVFLGKELKEEYYKGFCKQQLWPLFHYLLPLSPTSAGRFDPHLWQAYVKANKIFKDKLVEVLSQEMDYVWIHDYHLMVLPSMLRKQFLRLRCGFFLHSPFPSSEIFRTFPMRDQILRSLLNADLLGFHTFDYARHFLSCCSRMLGVEHVTSRGAIMLEYYGRNVGIKIMPTGINCNRLLSGLQWKDTIWRRGELQAQFKGQTVLIGVDDMDLFKGIELKLQAVQRLLDTHSDLRGKMVLVQVTNAPRSTSGELTALHDYCVKLVAEINDRYGTEGYKPVVWLERPVPLYERIALYSIADVAVVTATRDGMNLVPYKYITCRQGAAEDADDSSPITSMVVVSEFVGCSPSVSGAIRVNPWSIDAVADGIEKAIKMPLAEQHLRHQKHWRYISQHTVGYWAQSFTSDLQKVTKDHDKMKCYGLGLALNTWKVVALTEHFRKLEMDHLEKSYLSSSRRMFLLDYDGTLLPNNAVSTKPSEDVLAILSALTADGRNDVYIISGRGRDELTSWFSPVERLGLAAEHGFYFKAPGTSQWTNRFDPADIEAPWKEMTFPILQTYTEATDGSNIEAKDSALVWHFAEADLDLGQWQAKELQDHLEGVLANEPVQVTSGRGIVEVKPQGVSKGGMVEAIMEEAANAGRAPTWVLCIGDDRSDEDMFTAIDHVSFSPHHHSEVFACTVGQKPSRAPFYVNEAEDVHLVLRSLADSSLPAASRSPRALGHALDFGGTPLHALSQGG